MTKVGGEDSEVEVDETFVGGKKKNMHKGKKLRYEQKGGASGKAVVQGILDRTARQMRAQVVPNVKRETLQAAILSNVKYGTNVYTDDAVAYMDELSARYIHEVVNKTQSYVRGPRSRQRHGELLVTLQAGIERDLCCGRALSPVPLLG